MTASSKIPICHVQLLPLMSGVQRITLQILDVLDRDRFEPHVVMQRPGPFSDELRERGVACHFVSNLVRPIHPWRDWSAYRDLKRLFAREQFQIVHTHCSKPGILGRVAARRAGVPHVIHHVQSFAFHEFSSRAARFVYGRMEKFAAPFGDRVIFVNHDDLAAAIDGGIVPHEKCRLIYNGTDLKPFRPKFESRSDSALRRAAGIGADGALIYFVARLEKPKQPLILPDIAVALDRRLPDASWKLLVAGEGSYRVSLERKIADLGIGRRIELAGLQSEADKYRTYHEADIVLQPSLWEGLSLTLIEAQAAGLPSVAGNVKGNREVVVPGTGTLCEPRNVDAYAAALEVLIRRPGLRIALGRAARKHAEEAFDVDRNMRHVTDLYEEMLAGVKSNPKNMAQGSEQSMRRAA